MRKKEIARLDVLFSEYIRKRAIQQVGGCERCGNWKADYKQLQCSHFWGRRKQSVRHNEDNAIGLCGACHMYFTSNPQEHYEWFKKRLGEERFELLNMQAQTYYKVDIEAVTIYLKAKLIELGEGND